MRRKKSLIKTKTFSNNLNNNFISNKSSNKNNCINNYTNYYINSTNRNYINKNLKLSNNKINFNDNKDDISINESSFEVMAMQTARNKWRNNKKEKNESNEMYDLLEIINDLKIYKYSNKKESVSMNLFINIIMINLKKMIIKKHI